jgi:hypothetical protein
MAALYFSVRVKALTALLGFRLCAVHISAGCFTCMPGPEREVASHLQCCSRCSTLSCFFNMTETTNALHPLNDNENTIAPPGAGQYNAVVC